MSKKKVYLEPSADALNQFPMNSPLCQSGLNIKGGDTDNGLQDFEYVEW